MNSFSNLELVKGHCAKILHSDWFTKLGAVYLA